jgi:hypothetical protein
MRGVHDEGDAVAREHEPWAIKLAGDEATRKAGDNLRAWAGDDRTQVRRFVDRLVGRDDRDPKLSGLLGEELVGRELAKLAEDWTVLHGVRVGAKADVDHLVIGPPGVFCLNTKRIDGDADIVVSPRQFRVNGYSRPYYPKAVKEACRVEVRLQAAVGVEVLVRPILVIVGADLARIRVTGQPSDVAVITRRELVRWLRRQPAALSAAQIAILTSAARRPATWDPTRVAQVLDRMPTSEPSAPTDAPDRAAASDAPPVLPVPPPPPALTLVPAEEPDVPTTVVRWTRYGHDRTYVNSAETGQRLGWRNEHTGAVHVEAGADEAVVRRALMARPTTA